MIDFCVAVHIAEVSEEATFLLLCAGEKKVRLACSVVCSVLRCRGMAGGWLSRLDMEIPLSLTSPSRTNQGSHEVYSAECTFTHTKHTWISGIPQRKEWGKLHLRSLRGESHHFSSNLPRTHAARRRKCPYTLVRKKLRRIQPHIIIVVGHPPQKKSAAKLLRR